MSLFACQILRRFESVNDDFLLFAISLAPAKTLPVVVVVVVYQANTRTFRMFCKCYWLVGVTIQNWRCEQSTSPESKLWTMNVGWTTTADKEKKK